MHSFKSVLKACRRYYEAGRLAAQSEELRAERKCRLAYENDPVRPGHYRCAIGAGLTLAECLDPFSGTGRLLVNGPPDDKADLQHAHDDWLCGYCTERTERQFLAVLKRLERKHGVTP